MACGLECNHCKGAIAPHDSIKLHNYSYHKTCKKCYVCSETDLRNAEIFKGVIFCESCCKRIFQCCTTAHRSKNSRNSNSRNCSGTSGTSSRRHHRRSYRLASSSVVGQHRIFEMVQQMASHRSQTSENSASTQYKSNIVVTSTALSVGLRDGKLQKSEKESEKTIAEVGIATEVTQELLRQMNYPVEYIPQNPQRPFSKTKKYKNEEAYESKSFDPRILELGASTEIATMPLRNKSEIPVQTHSDPAVASEKKSESTEPLTESYGPRSDDYPGSYQKRFNKSDKHSLSLLNLLKIPIQKFKKNIIDKRSLVVIEAGDAEPIMQKTKRLLENKSHIHQKRGLMSLYPTIIKKQTNPFKMGWLPLITKSRTWRSEMNVQRCKHFHASHSYRCMRALVMSRAGPTKKELKEIRTKIFEFIFPKWLRNLNLADEITMESYTQSVHTHTQSTRTYTQSTVTRAQSSRTGSRSNRSKDQSVSIRLINST